MPRATTLADITNDDGSPPPPPLLASAAAAPPRAAPVRTFARKLTGKAKPAAKPTTLPPSAPPPPPPPAPRPLPASDGPLAAAVKARGGGKAARAASERMAQLKAYFDEVDSFVLEVETVGKAPSPPWALKAARPSPQKTVASVAGAGNPSDAPEATPVRDARPWAAAKTPPGSGGSAASAPAAEAAASPAAPSPPASPAPAADPESPTRVFFAAAARAAASLSPASAAEGGASAPGGPSPVSRGLSRLRSPFVGGGGALSAVAPTPESAARPPPRAAPPVAVPDTSHLPRYPQPRPATASMPPPPPPAAAATPMSRRRRLPPAGGRVPTPARGAGKAAAAAAAATTAAPPRGRVAEALSKLRLTTPAKRPTAKPEAEADAPAADPPFTRLLRLAGHPPAAPLPSMDAAIGKVATLAGSVKIGEGSYGEAFRTGCGAVVKVIPFSLDPVPADADVATVADVVTEAETGMALCGLADPAGDTVTTGFAGTRAVAVCRGRYSATLAAEWHAWKAAHGTENGDPAAAAKDDSLFAVLVCDDSGVDLERATIPSPQAAVGILAQAVTTLAAGEAAAHFEHRDLHWGNVLVAALPAGADAPAATLHGERYVVVGHGGVRVSLIDFTLSRMAAGDGDENDAAGTAPAAAWADLDADPEIFTGPRGNIQADTYRAMRKLVHKKAAATKKAGASPWAAHVPATNALWLAYLAAVLLEAKAYDKADAHVRALRGFKRRALGAPSAAALVGDPLFEGVIVKQPA